MSSSIYDFKVIDGNGSEISLNDYKNKVLLIVNVASKCGLTPQYKGLQKLYDELASQITNGNLYTPVESAYRLDQLSDALKHAYQTERNGKVQLMPNG